MKGTDRALLQTLRDKGRVSGYDGMKDGSVGVWRTRKGTKRDGDGGKSAKKMDNRDSIKQEVGTVGRRAGIGSRKVYG